MNKKFFLLVFFSLSLIIFSSCSVSEDSDKYKNLSIYVPSSLSIVSKPADDSSFIKLVQESGEESVEWYEYSNLSIRQLDGILTQNIKNFQFGIPYSVVVGNGSYQMNALVAMTKIDPSMGGDMLDVTLYRGTGYVIVDDDDDEKITSLTIQKIYTEQIGTGSYKESFLKSFDIQYFLPGNVTFYHYYKNSIDDEEYILEKQVATDVVDFTFQVLHSNNTVKISDTSGNIVEITISEEAIEDYQCIYGNDGEFMYYASLNPNENYGFRTLGRNIVIVAYSDPS